MSTVGAALHIYVKIFYINFNQSLIPAIQPELGQPIPERAERHSQQFPRFLLGSAGLLKRLEQVFFFQLLQQRFKHHPGLRNIAVGGKAGYFTDLQLLRQAAFGNNRRVYDQTPFDAVLQFTDIARERDDSSAP